MFLNMMDCLKFNRLEIYKFMAFDYCSFKTSYVFLGSMQIKTSFLFALSLNSSCIFYDFCQFFKLKKQFKNFIILLFKLKF
ncbi:Hypothetical protein MOVI_0800 [Mesomycoplasma ovipneumoniae 14811]|uniref:Uncharacterized protein n=1 Tax=Mesomycoplasma ovipneumoniae 14811 TaxID=1188239 RepID=A0A014L7F7_9BACT|nr:Hypothetical protein MOVI_0800 [Mesomycoplasma ovipneumoniae 14811]